MPVLSGLYFRGKLAYAHAFAAATDEVRVLTAGRGLLTPGTVVTQLDMREFATHRIDLADSAYVNSLRHDAEQLAARAPDEVVLLRSAAAGVGAVVHSRGRRGQNGQTPPKTGAHSQMIARTSGIT